MLDNARLLLIAPFAALVAACSPAPDEAPGPAATESAPVLSSASGQALAQRLLDTMGGREALESVATITLEGEGMRTRMGQIATTGGADPVGSITGVTETIDLAGGRAAFDYDVTSGDFSQHRTEVLTRFDGELVGLATGPGRPNVVTSVNGLFSWATQNSPEMLLRRNVIGVALAAAGSAAAEPAVERDFAGGRSLYATAELGSGEEIGLYFDPETGLLDGFTALDTETMLGDVRAEYRLDDYRNVDGLTLPFSITIDKGGRPYASIAYSSIRLNDPAADAIFVLPDDAVAQAEEVLAADGSWAPLAWNRVADGVYHAVGYSHHSMVVEFPDFVSVVEAPYTEAQSLSLARIIEDEIGKPIRYVVPTHPHYDHTGGVRALAAYGATVLVAAGHEAELRGIVESPHTNPPDELARALAAGSEVGFVEPFMGEFVIEEGNRRLELYEVAGIPHVNPKVLAFVPDAGVLFQSDLFFGGAGPDATALHAAVEERGLVVEQIVGGHGGVLPFSSLRDAVSAD